MKEGSRKRSKPSFERQGGGLWVFRDRIEKVLTITTLKRRRGKINGDFVVDVIRGRRRGRGREEEDIVRGMEMIGADFKGREKEDVPRKTTTKKMRRRIRSDGQMERVQKRVKIILDDDLSIGVLRGENIDVFPADGL